MLSASRAGMTATPEAGDDGRFDRHPALWMWAIVALGAVLRLVALGHKSFWIDEIASVVIAGKPSDAFWHFLWHDEGNMALYYLLLRPWVHLGTSEAVVRLLSVLPGVLTIPLLYLLGKRLFGRDTGMLVAALFALNPCAIACSQEARAYSFLVLAVVISTYRFVRLIEGPSYRFAVAYGIVAGFTCYFHYFGVLIPAAHAISLVAMPRGRRPWKQYAVAGIVFVLLAIPVLWMIHAQDIGHLSWVQPPSLLEFYHLGVFLAADGGKAVGAVLLAVDLVLMGLFLAKLRAAWQQRDNDLQRWRHTLVAGLFFSPILIVLAVSIVRPAFYHRFLIICLPSFVMMTAVGALQIRHRRLRISTVICVCILSLVSTVIVYTRVTEEWRGVVTYLIAEAQPQDRVLYYQSLGAFAAENYWNWLPGGSAPRPKEVDANPPSTDWEQQIGNAPRVWLVLYRAKVDDPEARAIEQELLKQYDVGGRKIFRGITVIEYAAKR
jgi:mannosyltransferase